MCGLAGYIRHPNETGFDPVGAANTLLIGSERRGTDATGAAWWEDDQIWTQKDAVTATKFAPHNDIGAKVTTAILHTRAATQGAPTNPDNNHPIQVAHIVGTHNGRVSNDTTINALTGHTPTGEVDSEALIALIATVTQPGSPISVERALALIEGPTAVAWLDQDHPDQVHLARTTGRRLWVGQTETGTILYASVPAAIINAAVPISRVNDLWELPAYTHITFTGPAITEIATIPRPGTVPSPASDVPAAA